MHKDRGSRSSNFPSIRRGQPRLLVSVSLACFWIFSAKPVLADPEGLCPAGYPKSFCSSTPANGPQGTRGTRTYRRFGLAGGARQAAVNPTISAAAVSEKQSWMPAPETPREPEFVSRIRGLDDLAVVTFWKTEGAKIYMGLEDGRPGIHLKQLRADSD